MKIDAQSTSSFSQTLWQLEESRNDRKKQRASEEEAKRLSALESLRNMPSAAETGKAAAQARMAQLKSQLEALMKYSMGSVNPRLIAQLAKELKSLVAQYGGTGISIPSVPSGSADSQASADAAQGASATDGASTETAAAPSEAEIQSALATASAATTAAGSEAAADDKTKAQTSSAIPGEMHAKGSANSADKAFFEEAKKLAGLIKALLKKGKEVNAEDEKKAKQAIAEMDETIRKVESNVMDGESSRVEFSYEPSGAAVSVSESSGNVATFISTYA